MVLSNCGIRHEPSGFTIAGIFQPVMGLVHMAAVEKNPKRNAERCAICDAKFSSSFAEHLCSRRHFSALFHAVSTMAPMLGQGVKRFRALHQIWRFPEVGVPPNHPFDFGMFREINHPAIGVPPLMETSIFTYASLTNQITTLQGGAQPGQEGGLMRSAKGERIDHHRQRHH